VDKLREEYLNRSATMRAKHRLSMIHYNEYLRIYSEEYGKLSAKYDQFVKITQFIQQEEKK
jgi:hypothetical protein